MYNVDLQVNERIFFVYILNWQIQRCQITSEIIEVILFTNKYKLDNLNWQIQYCQITSKIQILQVNFF